MLDVEHLSVSFDEHTVVDDVSFSVVDGQWLMLIGPNGAGKSTIASSIAQMLPYSGCITFDGRDLRKFRPIERARRIGTLMQAHAVDYGFSVEEVVRLGRYPYSPGVFSGLTEDDDAAIERALVTCGLEQLSRRTVTTLSGGELQRVFLAQLFAQDPSLLILDEPTNNLDIIYQKQVFELVSSWITTSGRSVISIVHDLSLARMFGTDALLLKDGSTVASGSIEQVMTQENLLEAFGIDIYSWMRSMYRQWE